MNYRKLHIDEAQKFWNLMNALDYETKYMLYEPGERAEKSNNIKRIECIISQSLQDQAFLIVAEEKDELVGYMLATRESLNRIAHTAYIVVGIRKEYNNRGIGSEFFKQLNEWAIANKVSRLELTVVCENQIAKHLYEKMGFMIEGTKKNSIRLDGRFVDEYYMAKIIEE